MSTLNGTGRGPVALLTALSFVATTSVPSPAAQPAAPTAAPAAPPATKPATKPATPAAAQAAVDGGWPRAYTAPSGAGITVYQPQVASWEDQKHVVAYSAVSYEVKSSGKPAMGTVRLEADTKVSVEHRLVAFNQMKI